MAANHMLRFGILGWLNFKVFKVFSVQNVQSVQRWWSELFHWKEIPGATLMKTLFWLGRWVKVLESLQLGA